MAEIRIIERGAGIEQVGVKCQKRLVRLSMSFEAGGQPITLSAASVNTFQVKQTEDKSKYTHRGYLQLVSLFSHG